MGTNAAVFAHQLAPLLAAFAGGLELIHVQGAHPSPPATKLVGALFPGPFYRYAAREGRRYVGLGDAVAQVTAALERERPEGLVGFSQGANVATMAVARAAARGSPLPSWALLFAGPQFGWAHDGGFGATPGDFASPLPVRSAHVVGDAEPQRDDCLALAKLWRAEGRAELRHSGDHRPFPAQPAEAQALAAAIKRWVLTGRAEEEGAGGGA